MKVRQLASKCRQLVQRVIKSQTICTSVVTVAVIYLGKVLILAAVQVVVDLVRQVIQIVRLRHHHGVGVEVDEQSPAEAQRARPLLQGAQHPLVGERRADDPGGQKLVAAAAVVGQVAAVAAAEGTEVTLVRLLSSV